MKRTITRIVILALVVMLIGEATGTWTLDPLYSASSCHLHVAGRTYLSPTHCGDGGKNLCWSPRYLHSIHAWPPGRRVWILSYSGISSVYVRSVPSGTSPTVVLVPRDSCYVPYALSGGP
jgi:hypothetical protein